MKRKVLAIFIAALLCVVTAISLSACSDEVKVGVSIGVGPAVRWEFEKEYMSEKAKTLDMQFEIKMNYATSPTTQTEDCKALIDSGIKVLVIMPRNADDVQEILDYAKNKNVKVISYARVILDDDIDLFVGYDSTRIGQSMGLFLSELVDSGDYIFLKGDQYDNNATLLYDGAMQHLNNIRNDINILLDSTVEKWSAEKAKSMVKQAIIDNNYHIDAILAPNDTIAGACAEAIAEIELEYNVKNNAIITGMDAELAAARRIVRDKQSMTVYMDLEELAHAAVQQAYNMARGIAPDVNVMFSNPNGGQIASNLIVGKVVTKENLDRILIDSNYLDRDAIYND